MEAAEDRRAFGMTPLMRAAHNGHQKAVLLLLELGASPHEQEEDGLTALHFAALAGMPSDGIPILINMHRVRV